MDDIFLTIGRIEKNLRFLTLLCLGAIHLALTGVMTWWSFVLLSPQDTFSMSISYDWLADHWPHSQHGWGFVFLGVACCGVIGMVPPHRLWLGQRTIFIRELSAGVLCGAHWTLAWATFSGSHFPAGGSFGAYGIYASLALFRMIMEAIV
jgi:hypothetical protein